MRAVIALAALLLCLAGSGCAGDDANGAVHDVGGADGIDDVAVDGGETSDASYDASVADVGDDATRDVGNEEAGAEDTATGDAADEPQPIGYRTVDLSYVPPGTEEERTIRVAIWYPAAEAFGASPRYFDLFPAGPNVYEGAPVAEGAPLPVHVYSHGHLGYAQASAFLMEHHAASGWIVAAPNHTGNTTTDFGTDRTTEIYFQRRYDVSLVLDYLEGLGEADPLGARVGEFVLASGHSFGGYTVLTMLGAEFDLDRLLPACEAGTGPGPFCSTMNDDYAAIFRAGLRDERVDAGVLMAAGDFDKFGAEGIAAVQTPVLQLTGAEDTSVRNETTSNPMWEALPPETSVRVDIANAGHLVFSNACELGLGGGLGCQDDDIEPEKGYEIIRTYVDAFAAVQRGESTEDDRAILSGEVEVAEEATLMRHR